MRTLLALALLLWSSPLLAQAPDRAAYLDQAVTSAESLWRRVAQDPITANSTRDLFSYALVLAETGRHLDRLERLWDVAAARVDRDPQSRFDGNFFWYLKDTAVTDTNSVEFCMQPATALWLLHRDRLPEPARRKLRDLLAIGAEGCLRHGVRASYTNIALMNAANLILLGEILERRDVADEGYRRLDDVVCYTWEYGIHEYDSPTYYGVDLDDLQVLERFAGRPAGKRAAQALLELFWRDLAANWWTPASKLAGSRSRDYDYLRGIGSLDNQLWLHGWLTDDRLRPSLGGAIPLLATWRPAPALREANQRYPRLVRQSWGIAVPESKTHYVLPDVTLGCSGALYGNMDIPLSVDFAGDRRQVRCYFIPDGRHDPYGKLKIAAGPHQKTLHLAPFWAGVQTRRDALGLVLYQDRHVPPETVTLESHLVMPLAVDQVWIDGERLRLDPQQPVTRELGPGQAVILRQGTAAAGFKAVLARDRQGGAAPVQLVWDGNEWGALRLTVVHQAVAGVQPVAAKAAAAFWVRVGSGLDEAGFAAWRDAFVAAQATVEATTEQVTVRAAGPDGPLAVGSGAPHLAPNVMEPAPYRGVLEVNGEEVGRPLLADLAPVQALLAEQARLQPLDLPATGLTWEAETGAVRRPMARAADPEASGGQYVWHPGEVGGRGGGAGSVAFRLRVRQAGVYYLWGRVLAPTPEDDSFFLAIAGPQAQVLPQTDWPVGTQPQWTWVAAKLPGLPSPVPLTLPAGDVTVEILVREDGTKLDRLFLTPDAQALPE